MKDKDEGYATKTAGKTRNKNGLINKLLNIGSTYHKAAFFCVLGNRCIMNHDYSEGLDVFGIKEFTEFKSNGSKLRLI